MGASFWESAPTERLKQPTAKAEAFARSARNALNTDRAERHRHGAPRTSRQPNFFGVRATLAR